MSFFGEKLKELRQKGNLNQGGLAEKMGVSQALISQFEKGQRVPTHAHLTKLCETFGVPSKDFFPEAELEKNVLMRKIKNMPPSKIKNVHEYVDFLESRD